MTLVQRMGIYPRSSPNHRQSKKRKQPTNPSILETNKKHEGLGSWDFGRQILLWNQAAANAKIDCRQSKKQRHMPL
jgi:hypothetical protein